MEDYMAPTYEVNPWIEAFRNAPRFGHGNDISKLFSSSNSMMADYLIGALVIAIIVLSFFSLWMLLLALFMCCGPARVGFLAGFAFKEPDKEKVFKLPRRIRTLFVFSCLLMISATVNAYIFSFYEISLSTLDAIESLKGIQTIGKNGRNEANTLSKEGQKSMNLAVTVADSLNRDKFCVNDALDENINGNRSAVVDHLLILGDYFTDEEISTMEDDVFAKIEERSEATISFISAYGVDHWQALFYLTAFTAIPALMFLGTLLTWCHKPVGALNGMLTWFFLPFFILFVTLSWFIVALFGSVMVMISDFCSGNQNSVGPNGSLLSIMTETGFQEDGLLFEGTSYWVNGCKSEFPFSFFSNYTQSADEALGTIDNFVSSMEDYGLENLSASCGGKDFQIIVDYMNTISEDYKELGTMSNSISDLVLCESINPLYVDLAHDATCTELPPLLVIALSLLFIVSFFGMVVITFRSSWLKVILRDRIEDYEFPIPSPQSQKNFEDVGLDEYEDASVQSRQGDGSEHAKIGSSRASLDHSVHSNHSSDTSPSDLGKMSVAVDDDALKDIPPSPGKDRAFKVY